MTQTLSAHVRTVTGKRVASNRAAGMVPAVVYGPDVKQNRVIEIDAVQLQKFLHFMKPNEVVALDIEDTEGKKETHQVLIHEISRDPIKETIMHVDIYAFSAKKKVHVDLPIVLFGTSPLEAEGALMMKNIEELGVECSPLHIPENISIDISNLVSFDQTIYIRDLKLPEGIVCRIDLSTPVVSAVAPVSEEELAAMEAVSTESMKEPELAGKIKEEVEERKQGENDKQQSSDVPRGARRPKQEKKSKQEKK